MKQSMMLCVEKLDQNVCFPLSLLLGREGGGGEAKWTG